MIYFIVTTCLLESGWYERRNQYSLANLRLIDYLKPYIGDKLQIIIVENQLATFMDTPTSFLDNFGVNVLYTKNNALPGDNKGVKELADIQECIQKFNIGDDDFIVKMTGRYIILSEPTPLSSNIHYDFMVIMDKFIDSVIKLKKEKPITDSSA